MVLHHSIFELEMAWEKSAVPKLLGGKGDTEGLTTRKCGIGQYRLVGVLGVGGLSFEFLDLPFNPATAIKFTHGTSKLPGLRERFGSGGELIV